MAEYRWGLFLVFLLSFFRARELSLWFSFYFSRVLTSIIIVCACCEKSIYFCGGRVVDEFFQSFHLFLFVSVSNFSRGCPNCGRLEKELADMRSKLGSTQKELETTRAELKTTRAELNGTRKALDSTQEELNTTRTGMWAMEAQFNQALNEMRQRYENQLEEQRLAIQELQAEIAPLQHIAEVKL